MDWYVIAMFPLWFTSLCLLSRGTAQVQDTVLDSVLRRVAEVATVTGHGTRQPSTPMILPTDVLDGSCDAAAEYRTIDGSCNNLIYPTYGMAFREMKRLLLPNYDDKKNRPRLFRGKRKPLPSARAISTNCLPPDDSDQLDNKLSLMAMQWGQFLDHDITATPEFDEPTDCCSTLSGSVHDHYYSRGPCFPIPIPSGDRYFTSSCMEFRRSIAASQTGTRQQMNVITSFIDASQIYGSTTEEMVDLRTNTDGLMRVSTFNMLPKTTRFHRPCVEDVTRFCFDSGDVRVNEFPGLTSMHMIMHRAHNRLATQLKELNPRWTDEKLFQEGRRIVSALLQHISYDSFLPIVLGKQGMIKHGLTDMYSYSANINPDIYNSFATAAYRFGHSMVTRKFRTFSNPHQLIDEMYFRPQFLISNEGKGVNDILLGIATQPCQKADKYFSTGVSDHLFQDSTNSGSSFDLVARNIQRGRDHGLPSYTKFYKLANRKSRSLRSSFVDGFDWGTFFNSQFTTFPDFFNLRPSQALSKRSARRTKRHPFWSWNHLFGNRRHIRTTSRLSPRHSRRAGEAILTKKCLSIYRKKLNDVDLFVGGMSEPAVDGGLVGKTFAFIIGKQFYDLKNGDRFWYENENANVSFTPDQLREIKKVTLARILCDNSDIEALQPDIFRQPSDENQVVSCSNQAIPEMDLSPWRDSA